MRFARNRLYIEEYIKCRNCGILIFENQISDATKLEGRDGGIYCSSWCVDWEAQRNARLTAEAL